MTRRERWNISRVAIDHPGLTLALWFAVAVAGAFAFFQLKFSLLPDITFPLVVVGAGMPSDSAEETEEKLTIPIETALSEINGLEESQSNTHPGRAIITLSFFVGTDLEKSTRAVESALAGLDLPPNSAHEVTPLNLNESAVVTYAISGSSLAPLEKLAALEGVAQTPTRPARFDGEPAQALSIIKHGHANSLDVVARVRAEVARLRAEHPTLQIVEASTQADFIREATHATIEALLVAVALSVLVIYPFLRSWRATLIAALAIPTSLLGTFVVMWACGFELETITLLALALVVGIIIDDAIVDVENIARHLDEGAEPRRAAIDATGEIGLTVTAATLTIVAVFLPVALMRGAIGQFFKPFGVTVSAAVLISLLVARTLSPLLAARWLKPGTASSEARITGWHRRVLAWSLRRPFLVLAIALATFAGGLALVPLLPQGFIPQLDRGEFKIKYNASSAPLEGAEKLEEFARAQPEVASVLTLPGTRESPRQGVLHVRLRADRTEHTATIIDRIRRELPPLPGVETSVEDIQFVEVETGDVKPLKAAIVGHDLSALDAATAQLHDRIAATPGFADVTTTGPADGIEHVDGRRTRWISANLTRDASLGEATSRVEATAREIFPPGISLRLGGDSARLRSIFASFGVTLALSVACIVGVLFVLFRTWRDPVVIVLSLPLAVVGAVLALLVVRADFGMISLLGVVFLFGLVNKNAILLVDCANQLQRSGFTVRDAILRAGSIRLRPILMTTGATVLGMLPIALGLGAGSELRAPMAVAIIGGLITSTLLSLLVVPVLYVLLHRGSGAERIEDRK